MTLSTGRALLSKHGGSSAAAASAALAAALEGLSGAPQLAHVTLALDVDAAAAADALRAALPPDAALLGRSINKRDADGTVEVLLLRSEAAGGIAAAAASADVSEGAGGPSGAVRAAAREAAEAALGKLEQPATFLVFCHSPGGQAAAAREGLDQVRPGVVAYGGPAVGDSQAGGGWALVAGEGAAVRRDDVAERQTALVAAVPGSLSFLLSAVIKTWAQPTYTEPLSYMTPTYVGDAQMDLLTAIRYNDWEKFIYCVEGQGVDVNTKWPNKQNQSPLLAACARVRTEMIEYLLAHGADPTHRNDGEFTAAMYTRMLTEYERETVMKQLKMLEEAGANTTLSPDEVEKLKTATGGRIFE